MSVILPHRPKSFTVNDRETVVLSVIESVPEKSNRAMAVIGIPNPSHIFWSLTMYDGKTQLLIENPINRYLINSPMLPTLKTNADGSLTLYIQNKSPGADKESNWLPAPNDTIYLVMRLYWPETTPPSILPAGDGTWQPPSVKRVS